ncbi:hypothetical protein [Aquimarina rhabdastrellae]
MIKKQFLKMIMLISLLGFIGCQDDEINIETTTNEFSFKVKQLTLSDLSKDKKVTTLLSKHIDRSKEKKESQKQEELILLTETITYLEIKDKYSYTFELEGEEGDPILKNLVVTFFEEGTYISDIVTYHFTPEERVLFNAGENIDLDGKVTSSPIDIESDILQDLLSKNRSSGDCRRSIWHYNTGVGVIYFDTREDCENEHGVGSCGEYVYVVTRGCGEGEDPEDDAGDSGSGGGATTGTTLGGNGSIHDTGITIPTGGVNVQQQILTEAQHIEKLKEQIQRVTGLQQRISNFKSRISTEFLEDGAVFDVTIDDQGNYNAREFPATVRKPKNVTIEYSSKSLVSMHFHPEEFKEKLSDGSTITKTSIPIFSIGDIKSFTQLFIYRQLRKPDDINNGNITDILVAEPTEILGSGPRPSLQLNSGVYALRISDIGQLWEINRILNTREGEKELKEKYERFIIEKCNLGENQCFLTQFIDFINTVKLEGLSQTGLGIAVYLAIETNGSITNWRKL